MNVFGSKSLRFRGLRVWGVFAAEVLFKAVSFLQNALQRSGCWECRVCGQGLGLDWGHLKIEVSGSGIKE